ncbi:MAG: hypothetical protein EP298_10090 [Gammaproteobacteria bacterium]|nr:MAG: hypothetical protein EP298_10090 [Gammaproteobacteria bacterium]UTW42126.1 hypothetical protein KFE69_11610 [bacterium SCSIO 12844]
MDIRKLIGCIGICIVSAISFANASSQTPQSAKQKQALQKVYTTQQSNVMCTSGAGNIKGCEVFSKQLGDAVTEADNAGVPRSETIKTELNAVSDGLKTTQPQRVTPGVAQ